MDRENKLKVPVVIFYSYSHRDENYREELIKQLTMLRRSGLIREWHDRKILPGEEWDKQISLNLETADLILLLISSDFLASDYCYDVEAKRALERHERGEAILVPIILRPVTWDLTPFSRIRALPVNAQPIAQWTNRDEAYVNVCEGILSLITSFNPAAGKPEPSGFLSRLTPRRTPAEAGTLELRKVLDAALPEQAAVGKTIALVVMVRAEDSEGLKKVVRINRQYGVGEEDVVSTGAFSLDFPVDEDGQAESLDLTIRIESPEFAPAAQSKTVRVAPERDSEPRIFLLTPQKTGELAVNLEVVHEETVISGCFLKTGAVTRISAPESANLVTVPLGLSHFVNAVNGDRLVLGTKPKISKLPVPNEAEQKSGSQLQSQTATLSDLGVPHRSFTKIVAGAAYLLLFGSLFMSSFLWLKSGSSGNANANNANVILKNVPVPASLFELYEAQKSYSKQNAAGSYGDLEQLAERKLIDPALASGEKDGYRFSIGVRSEPAPGFDLTAVPVGAEAGKRNFYLNERGGIYYAEGDQIGSRENPGIPLN